MEKTTRELPGRLGRRRAWPLPSAALTAVVADRHAPDRRGVPSARVGAGPGPSLLAVFPRPRHRPRPAGRTSPRPPRDPAGRRPVLAHERPPLDVRPIASTFWAGPVAHPGPALAWAGRFLRFPARLVGNGTSLVTAPFASGVRDRTGRRKPFVVVAALVFAAGLLAVTRATAFSALLVALGVAGIGLGVHLAVDLALVTRPLPGSRAPAKDLGPTNLAGGLPGSLIPAVAPRTAGDRRRRWSGSEPHRKPPTKVTSPHMQTDLPYGPLPAHRFDLHLPSDAAGPLPLVVYVHGGGWMTGDKSWLREEGGLPALAELLLGNGWAVAAVNYRLSGEATFPAPLDDVIASLDRLTRSAPDLGLDPSRIVLMGDSAGGHLALLAAYATDERGRPRLPVRAVVSYYGVTDLRTALEERRSRVAAGAEVRGFPPDSILRELVRAPTPEGRLLGVEPDLAEAEALAASASPYRAAGPASPPTLLFAGRYDAVSGSQGAEALARRLEEHAVPSRCVLAEAGHGEAYFFTDPALRQELLTFLGVHAGPESAAAAP
ncbi:alpha/beta hydrolase [Streptomyces sp. NPDC004542]|uniref:alpha/beta hydrolase n=1 Tax=Streptomyces sp. NPDC004542 TaxID=3154281 RepID=UPI0033A62303